MGPDWDLAWDDPSRSRGTEAAARTQGSDREFGGTKRSTMSDHGLPDVGDVPRDKENMAAIQPCESPQIDAANEGLPIPRFTVYITEV